MIEVTVYSTRIETVKVIDVVTLTADRLINSYIALTTINGDEDDE